MSSRHNRRARRAANRNNNNADSVPLLVERIERAHQSETGKSYEEANWEYLSPAFRAAHNKLLQARGLAQIPPPKVDRYVKPSGPRYQSTLVTDAETLKAAREFMTGAGSSFGPVGPLPGGEGFRER